MIVRQRFPVPVKVNVVPSRRRAGMRGLGDTCTPTNCPNGPYGDSGANYDYWLVQGQSSGVVATPAQGTDPDVDTAAVTAAQNQSWASYADLQTAVGWELCNQTDVSQQFACSQRNTQRAQQISNIQQQYGDRVPSSILGSIVPVVSGSVANPPSAINNPTPITSTPANGGSLSFTTSRGGTTLYPGDTWTIKISGARANTAVSWVGGKNGAMNSGPTGTTDGNGNFSVSGTVDSSQVGSWYQAFTVGGFGSSPAIGIGSISFTVQAATTTASTTTDTTTSGTTTTGSTQQTGSTQAATTTANWFTDEMISGVPNWALVAAAAAVAFLVLRGKK